MSTLTRSVRLMLAALVALACLLPAPLRADEVKKASSPRVVLVGINDYADKAILPRKHAEADAKALYDLLTSKDHLGADPQNVRLLLGAEDDKRKSKPATRANILDAVRWLANESKRDDLVVFAYFGQGGSLGERGDRTCYFASDSSLKDRSKNAVAAADIGAEFDKLKSKKVTVFLDVNFKGFEAGKEAIPEPGLGDNPYREFLGDDEGEDHISLPGRALFMATNGLSASPDLEDHGLFATALLAGLKGEADKEGYEPDGVITVDELTTYLNKNVPELKRKHNKMGDGRKGDHYVFASQSSHFALTTNPKVIAKARERLSKLELLADRLGKEMAEEGRRVLEKMPRLEGARNLRKEYQKMLDGDQTLDQLKERRAVILESMKLPENDAHRFARKVLEAVQIADEEYVKEVNRGELVGWAVRGMYRHLDEKIPDAVSEKLAKVKELGDGELGLLLRAARQGLGKREDLEKHKDIDIALQRMLIRLDPYTTYIDPEQVERFKIDYKGEFTGIGVQIRKDQATGALYVVTPIKGSPSHRIGLMTGDLITSITRTVNSDGEPLDPPEVLHTKDLELNEAVKKILGKQGTRVTLTIKREGVEKPFEVTITRNRIELESVFGVKRRADDSWDHWLDAENKIAYVRLTNFARNSYKDLAEAVRDLRRGGMRGLVLDLRFNPGGLLDSARQISDLFIDEGPIVSVRRPRRGLEDRMDGVSRGSELGFPMVVLVNGMSASASEIVSACLQDHKRAVIMGERSYGKGSVQNIQEFDGGQIKITIASFWRPNGKNLNKSSTGGKDDDEWGVRPEKEYLLDLSRKERDDLHDHLRNIEIIPRRDRVEKEKKTEFKDRQLDTALKYLREQARASR
jgi:carboxyl-terminal processing protease